MPRTDGDTWDLASSVGVTATVVAMQRAIASRSVPALITDPYAVPLVTAVGVESFARHARGEYSRGTPAEVSRAADGIAARTKYFDDFFADAAAAGIRQFVILASGLDARAYRLPWPAGATVYELDQPEVIEFKIRTLTDLGARPTVQHRPISIDLRDNWPAAMRDSGFHPGQPTAWIAEGLLIYLPPDAQDLLLGHVTALSAPGSRIATENIPGLSPEDLQKISDRIRTVQEEWQKKGFEGFNDVAQVDVADLFYAGDRNEAAAYLARLGWKTVLHKSSDLFAQYGLTPAPDNASAFGDTVYLTAALG